MDKTGLSEEEKSIRKEISSRRFHAKELKSSKYIRHYIATGVCINDCVLVVARNVQFVCLFWNRKSFLSWSTLAESPVCNGCQMHTHKRPSLRKC